MRSYFVYLTGNVMQIALVLQGGYGFCHVPAAPGMFELDCPTWLPQVWLLLATLSEIVKGDGLLSSLAIAALALKNSN